MSKLEVDAIEPQSGTTLTLGASGDTISVPSGATLNASSATVNLPVVTPQITVYTTGTGTYTVPSGTTYLHVKMV